jgi:4,5-DOPA dioxygenase extradiol
MSRVSNRALLLITTTIIAVLAIFLASNTTRQTTSNLTRHLTTLLNSLTSTPTTITTNSTASTMGSLPTKTPSHPSNRRPPVYFLSHGGPSTMYDTAHPVFPRLQAIGREILEEVKPKGLVVFSAHWQSDWVGGVEVAVPEDEGEVELAKKGKGLLYDFYGFPKSCECFPSLVSLRCIGRGGVLGEAAW